MSSNGKQSLVSGLSNLSLDTATTSAATSRRHSLGASDDDVWDYDLDLPPSAERFQSDRVPLLSNGRQNPVSQGIEALFHDVDPPTAIMESAKDIKKGDSIQIEVWESILPPAQLPLGPKPNGRFIIRNGRLKPALHKVIQAVGLPPDNDDLEAGRCDVKAWRRMWQGCGAKALSNKRFHINLNMATTYDNQTRGPASLTKRFTVHKVQSTMMTKTVREYNSYGEMQYYGPDTDCEAHVRALKKGQPVVQAMKTVNVYVLKFEVL